MAISDILFKRAHAMLGLLLGDSGYSVTQATMDGDPFFIVSGKRSRFAVILSMKSTLKAARAGGNDGKELQKLLTMPVLQVNAFYGAKKTNLVMVAPSVLQLVKSMTGRPGLTVETLPEAVDTEYVFHPLDDYDPTREIVLRWCVDDVHRVRPDLTESEAKAVLEAVYMNRDVGVTFEFIEAMAERLYMPRCLPCTLYPADDPNTPVPGMFYLATGGVATNADVLGNWESEGYTHIDGISGRVEDIRYVIPVTPGQFTLEAFGDERFDAPDGYYGDYIADWKEGFALTRRLELAGALPPATRNAKQEPNER
jgi:hypothetical protein